MSSIRAHFERREALYRHLGIVPSSIRGRRVAEFGPGSGHNAIYTASLLPSKYILIDANPTGLKETRENLSLGTPKEVDFQIIESTIEDFVVTDHFDLVLCEGVLPWQIDPVAYAKKVGSLCQNSGIFVLTTIDAASFLGESLRRLIAACLVPVQKSARDRLEVLEPFFAPHLATLAGMSRPVRDWIFDNILIPYVGKPFSMKEAVEGLSVDFDFYASSPHFVTDWRWYKTLVGSNRHFNENAVEIYLSNIGNIVDYRVTLQPHAPEIGFKILTLADQLFFLMVEMERKQSTVRMKEAIEIIAGLESVIAPISTVTATSFKEVIRFLSTTGQTALPTFQSFFGRGQQYLSFIRKT